MAASTKVNLKNMDYFKFRKYVIDGNRDETGSCSKEVASLCACVQTLNFRDDEFDPGGQDWSRFDEICSGYRLILQGKRVEPLDVRIKSGWWGEQKSGLSAGKIKASLLMEVLVSKTKDWMARHGEVASKSNVVPLEKSIEGPGVYVFKHKERSCFQLVQTATNIFQKCSEFLKSSFEGNLSSPLTSLIIVSLVTDWDFYFVPVAVSDSDEILRVIENDLILKNDSIWPHGLNLTLTLQTTFDLTQFRRSCIRHKWPPERDFKNNRNNSSLNVDEIRKENLSMFSIVSPTSPQKSPLTTPELPSLSPINGRPSSAKVPPQLSVKAPQSSSTIQPRTPRPSTAKIQGDKQKVENVAGKFNHRSPFKKSSTQDLHKIMSQTNKDAAKLEDPLKKNKPKESGSPEPDKKKETIDNNSIGQHPQTMKRSNTFTYEDDEYQGGDQKLEQRGEAITMFLTAQTS